jgi:hypothetical protein
VVPEYATEASTTGNLSTNADEKDVPTTAPTPVPTTQPVPGIATQAEGPAQGNPLPAVAAMSAALLLLAAFLGSPRISRSVLRRRRLKRPKPGGEPPPPDYPHAGLAWAELLDLATDFGMPSTPSETPRHFSDRFRSSPLLGDASGFDDAAHRAVASLTADFERQRYGRPSPAAAASASSRIAVVRESLRNNSGWWARFRADWLPPSLMRRWLHALGAPFRGLATALRWSASGLAGSWRGLRRLLPQRR